MKIEIKENRIKFFIWAAFALLFIFIASVIYISFLNEKSAWQTFGVLCGGIAKGCQEILYGGVQAVVNQKKIVLGILIFFTCLFFLNLFQEINKSNKYIKSFKVYKKVGNLAVIDSEKFLAFTGGFIRQKIYLSRKLLDKLKWDELKAILLHESSHISKYDNLKNLIFIVFAKTFFFFPVLRELQKINSERVENRADSYVINNMANGRKSLLSSIFKFSEYNKNLILSHFSIRSKKLILGNEVRYSLNFVNLLITFVFIFMSGFVLLSQNAFAKSLPETQCTARVEKDKEQNMSLDQEISTNINLCLFK